MAAGKPATPSSQALACHIADLEAELANIDFRLMSAWQQRRFILDMLVKSTRQAALLSMQPHPAK